MRAVVLIACAYLAVLTACVGSPVAIWSESPQQLTAEKTTDLCPAVPGFTIFSDIHEAVLQELLRRNAVRPAFVGRIRSHDIALGMNTCEVRAAMLLPPETVNRTATAGAVEEQWVWGHLYVYFTNGIVTTFQD